MLMPPYYFAGASDEGIEDAFKIVLDCVAHDRLRACLYHIAQVCGVPVPAAALSRLRRRSGGMIAGVKNGSRGFASFAGFRSAAREVAALVGDERLNVRALTAGGTICGMVNLTQRLLRRLMSDPSAQPAIERACESISSIPAPKTALAAMVGEPIWRSVRSLLRATSDGVGALIAVIPENVESRQ